MNTTVTNNRQKTTEEQKDLRILKSREREISLSKEEFEELLRKKKLL